MNEWQARRTPVDPGRDRLIRRQRLVERLERDWPAPLTVVAAPAGFGKTTGVENWLRRRRERPIWVGLDEDDNDAVLLWSRIFAEAVRTHGIGARARAALEATRGSTRAAIQAFAAELREAEHPPVVVLDDIHLIDDPACLRSIEHFASLLPGGASLMLLTRREPPLPLDRFDGRGQLLRIGPTELAFDREECRALLGRYGIELDPAALDSVFAATGGWPAAVYMSALWLRDADDPSAAARAMTTPHDQLARYLLSEVIGGLDPDVREFMRRSAVLPRMSGELCDDVLARGGSEAAIAHLRETILLVRSDRGRPGWHRYHALLRGVLLAELEVSEPGAAATLHRRAAAWFLRHDMPEDAAEHARDGGDFETVADLVAELHLPLVRTGRSATVLRWAEALPPELLDRRPDATMAAASAAELAARPSVAVRRWLTRAEAARGQPDRPWSAENEVEWQMLTAGSTEDGIAAAIEAARAGVAAAADVPHLSHVSRAVLAMFLEYAGEATEAEAVARSVLEDPGVEARPFALLMAAGTLALLELGRGRPRTARRPLDEARELMARAGIEDGPIAARIRSCEALVLIAEGEAGAARRAAERALEHPFDTAPLLAWTYLVAADARSLEGDFRAAREALTHADELLAASPDPGRLPTLRGEVASRVDAGAADGAVLADEVSPAELRVLRLLAEGLTRTEIASALVVSLNTVKTHQRRLYRKLGASERDTVVARARSHGLLEAEGAAESPG